MNHYKEGDIVQVVFAKVRITDVSDFESAEVTGKYEDDCGIYPVPIPLGRPDVTIKRVAPADWPPQPKDVWADRDGDPWIAQFVDIPESDPFIVLIPSVEKKRLRYREEDMDAINNEYGPFTLLIRDGKAVDGER